MHEVLRNMELHCLRDCDHDCLCPDPADSLACAQTPDSNLRRTNALVAPGRWPASHRSIGSTCRACCGSSGTRCNFPLAGTELSLWATMRSVWIDAMCLGHSSRLGAASS